MQVIFYHADGTETYSFTPNSRFIYVLEDNFINLYRAYFIPAQGTIGVICNGLPAAVSFNNDTHKRIHVYYDNNTKKVTIEVDQSTAYRIYAIKMVI